MTSSTLQSYFHYHEGSSSPSLSSSSSSSAFSSSSSSHSNSSGYPWRRQPNSAAISSLRNSSDSFPSSSLCFWRGRAPLPAPYLETNWRQRSPIQSSTIPDTVLTGTGIAHFTDSELTGLIARLPFVREEIPLDDPILADRDLFRPDSGDETLAGHPCVILEVLKGDKKGRVMCAMCTSFGGKALIEKYPGSAKSGHRRGWLLISDARREAHDDLPVLHMEQSKAYLRKPTYVICSKTFELGLDWLSLYSDRGVPKMNIRAEDVTLLQSHIEKVTTTGVWARDQSGAWSASKPGVWTTPKPKDKQ